MPWARAYGLIPSPGSSPHAVPLIGPGPGFNPDYALTTDLDDPARWFHGPAMVAAWGRRPERNSP